MINQPILEPFFKYKKICEIISNVTLAMGTLTIRNKLSRYKYSRMIVFCEKLVITYTILFNTVK